MKDKPCPYCGKKISEHTPEEWLKCTEKDFEQATKDLERMFGV